MEGFSQMYDAAADLIDFDALEESINAAKLLVERSDLPLYYRVKTLMLLGTMIKDWNLAEIYRQEAEDVWHDAHRCNPPGKDVAVDTSLEYLRECLDQLKEYAESINPDKDTDDYETEEEEEAQSEQSQSEVDKVGDEDENGDEDKEEVRGLASSFNMSRPAMLIR